MLHFILGYKSDSGGGGGGVKENKPLKLAKLRNQRIKKILCGLTSRERPLSVRGRRKRGGGMGSEK